MSKIFKDYIPTSAMARNRKSSATSTPVSIVEQWLDNHPEKRCENKPDGGIVDAKNSRINRWEFKI